MAPQRAQVLVVGGGVAGLEATLALRALAAEQVQVTVLDPARELVYRPMTVAEPFGAARARRHPLDELVAAAGAKLVRVGVEAVDPDARRVVLRSGDTLGYDTLLLAPGARALPAFDDAVTFGLPGGAGATRELVEGAASGALGTLAFVGPNRIGWSLPLYELALLTASACRARGATPRLVLATPEDAPLEAFGPEVAADVARLLDGAGIAFRGSAFPDVRDGRLLAGAGEEIEVDGVIALPLLRGPGIAGVPAEPERGFIPVDRQGRVAGVDDVYAAGDAIDFPVKQGGLAAQEGEAAARHIAARHGADVRAVPLRPVLRGMLLTGDGDRFLRRRGAGAGEAPSAQPLWWPPTKIAGRHLAPFLAERDAAELGAPPPPPEGFVEVEVEVGAPVS